MSEITTVCQTCRETCAKVADAHKGAAARKRRARGPQADNSGLDEIYAEERGEDIAAEMIAVAIRATRAHFGVEDVSKEPSVSREEVEALRERVNQFTALELPGQPRMMHMGTSYLVNDLWRVVQALAALQIRGAQTGRAGSEPKKEIDNWHGRPIGELSRGELIDALSWSVERQRELLKESTPADAGTALAVSIAGGHLIELSCDDQFAIATAVAANIGYVLAPAPCATPTPSPANGEWQTAAMRWFEKHDAYHKASDIYNARVTFIRQQEAAGRVGEFNAYGEYKTLNETQRAALREDETLWAALSAAPIPSTTDLIERLRDGSPLDDAANAAMQEVAAVLSAAVAAPVDADAANVMNMLVLCGECGGKGPGETYVAYLRRLIDALIHAKTRTGGRSEPGTQSSADHRQ